MKKLILVLCVFITQQGIAQIETNCDDVNLLPCCPTLDDFTPEIIPWEEVGCKTDSKAAAYTFFPKTLEYNGYIFRQLQSCTVQNSDYSLFFDYCIPKTRQTMRVEIIDLKHPHFESEIGKAKIDIYLLSFKSEATVFGAHNLSINKKFKNSRIISPRFSPYGGSSEDVSYVAHVNDRYYINISINDKPKYFTEAIALERFLNDYINQINLEDIK